MVDVYLDESEDRGSGVFTLGGWAGTAANAWDQLIPAWKAMLSAAPHPITEFHTVDIEQGRGDFHKRRGWTRSERQTLMKQAAGLIVDKMPAGSLVGFGCSIRRKDFDWQEETSYVLYAISYQVLMSLLVERLYPLRGFRLVFDEKEKVQKHVREHFKGAMEMINSAPAFEGIRGLLLSVDFKPSVTLEPLQAADFMAYERRKRNSDAVMGKHVRRNSFLELCRVPHHCKVLDRRYYLKAIEKQYVHPEELKEPLEAPDDDD
jgi:hypothetical protein